jgi:hypothetical protein
MKLRQMLPSLLGFGFVMAVLVYADERVRDQFERFIYGGDGVSSWNARLVDIGDALGDTFTHHSIENGPLLVFAVVGLVLFVFMVRA